MKKAIILLAVILTACGGGEKPIQPGEKLTINTTAVEVLVYHWNPEKQYFKVNFDETSRMEAAYTFTLDLTDSTYHDAILSDIDLRQCEIGTTENGLFGIKPPHLNVLIEITRSKVIHTHIDGTRKTVREYR